MTGISEKAENWYILKRKAGRAVGWLVVVTLICATILAALAAYETQDLVFKIAVAVLGFITWIGWALAKGAPQIVRSNCDDEVRQFLFARRASGWTEERIADELPEWREERIRERDRDARHQRDVECGYDEMRRLDRHTLMSAKESALWTPRNYPELTDKYMAEYDLLEFEVEEDLDQAYESAAEWGYEIKRPSNAIFHERWEAAGAEFHTEDYYSYDYTPAEAAKAESEAARQREKDASYFD